MAVSSAAHPDRVRSMCRKVVKEVAAASGPGGMCVVENLDASCDAIDKKDNLLSNGGSTVEPLLKNTMTQYIKDTSQCTKSELCYSSNTFPINLLSTLVRCSEVPLLIKYCYCYLCS